MTPSDFKKGFSTIATAMYSDLWIKNSHLEKSVGSSFEYILKNPIKQLVIISLDQITERMILKGCKKSPGNYYKIYLFKGNKKVQEIAISSLIGYGHLIVDQLPPGDYKLIVKNWNDGDPTNFEADFRITTYTFISEIKIWESIAYIEDDLE